MALHFFVLVILELTAQPPLPAQLILVINALIFIKVRQWTTPNANQLQLVTHKLMDVMLYGVELKVTYVDGQRMLDLVMKKFLACNAWITELVLT